MPNTPLLEPRDMAGRPYKVGQSVVKAEAKRGFGPGLKLRTVIAVEGGRVTLNGVSPRPLRNPQNCLIIPREVYS